MIELRGKNTSAKVFTDNVEQSAISQIINLCNQDAFKDAKVRIMPDCLTEDTEVLTDEGYVLIKDVDVKKNKVAQYDFNNSSIVFDYCKAKVVRPLRDGEVVYEQGIPSLSTKILSTGNHRNLFMSGVLKTKDIPSESILSNYRWFCRYRE